MNSRCHSGVEELRKCAGFEAKSKSIASRKVTGWVRSRLANELNMNIREHTYTT